MFNEPIYSLDDQENEGTPALPSGWQQQDLADEFIVSPVEAARAHFREGASIAHSWRFYRTKAWRIQATKADTALLRMLTKLRSSQFDATLLFYEDTFSDVHFWNSAAATFVGLDESQTSNADSPQLAFGLRGIFTPSKSLTDYWVRGVKTLAQEATVSSSGLELASTQLEIQQEFSKMLVSLFGTLGQQLRYGNTSDVNITQAGRFLLQYQIKICDRFLIIPDEAADFLRTLRTEMITALSDDSTIEGAWGRISVNSSGELFYMVVPPKIIRDVSFVPSEDIE